MTEAKAWPADVPEGEPSEVDGSAWDRLPPAVRARYEADGHDVPIPDRAKLSELIGRIHPSGGELHPDDLGELLEAARWCLHHLPVGLEFLDLVTRNPVSRVYFRAGLLACREYMARFVEQGGRADIAQSIRANWWPRLGPDPGPPRRFDFDECAQEKPGGGYSSKPMGISVEALPRALGFLDQP